MRVGVYVLTIVQTIVTRGCGDFRPMSMTTVSMVMVGNDIGMPVCVVRMDRMVKRRSAKPHSDRRPTEQQSQRFCPQSKHAKHPANENQIARILHVSPAVN